MEYIFILLAAFIGMLMLMQMVFFEITRKKMLSSDNINWFLSLDKPFSYRRVGYMVFICFVCYMISSPEPMFSASWFIFFVLFLAIGIIADATVQYLILVYGKQRCRKEIEESRLLENELIEITQNMVSDDRYEEPTKQYDEIKIAKNYIQPTDHVSFLTIDSGSYVQEFDNLPEAVFVIEPYGDIQRTKEKFDDENVKVTKLTPSGQMPFKDGKMDMVICENSNYEKTEVHRVLKKDGYFIVNQNGTANLKEFLQVYVPYGIKGSWDAFSCAQTLEDIGMRIIDKFEDYGTLRFHSIQAIHTFFSRVSPDLADINKYKIFYLKALKQIKQKSIYEMTTHHFLVIAQKV